MKMTVIVSNDTVSKSEQSLRDACAKHGIKYERLVAASTSYQTILDSDPATYDHFIYRIGTTTAAAELEALIAAHSPTATTIYRPLTIRHPRRHLWEMSAQLESKLSVIPTLLVDATWQTQSQEVLARRIDSIDGYPFVLKVLGKSHGQGVQMIHSGEELGKVLATMEAGTIAVARKYLADYRHYRLVVVADRVVAAIEYHKPDDDFRTNAVAEPNVTAVELDALPIGTQKLAIEATAIRGAILSGVDILVDSSTDTAYLAEVNVPCNFARAEGPTGVHIGELIVEAMQTKRATEQGVNHAR